MELSDRISRVAVSATLVVSARAKELKAGGADVVSFGAGEPDFDTPAFIKDAAKAALDAGDTKYLPAKAAALKQAIAEKLRRENGLRYAPEQVEVTFGGKHALYAAFQALINPGEKVLIPSPYWVSYPEQVTLAGGESVFLETSPATGFKITPEQVLANAKGAKVLVINSPSNPTGVTYTPEELAAIAEAVLQTDLTVFSDEIYEKLLYGDTRFVSFAALDERLMSRTLTFNGLAKTFAMTGWRLGWVAGPVKVIKAVAKLMSQETSSPVSFAQAGAYAAYTDPRAAETIEAMRREFEKRGRHMHERLNAIEGVSCVQPTGAFYCFPDVSAHYGRTLGGVEIGGSLPFASACLEGAGVALVPGVAFGEDRCVRLSFATSLEQIDKGLDRLGKLLAG
ncbi:MAG TPA: pyridoxal phosphate-dependent aminotransferase [Phycisphaerae bacterium]|nr:pyridoxal phosphate-dependent aminotransferase [Phycisphaerae bacterium]